MHVLALGSRTSHDGGIADRRDVVATYGSCHTSGDGDDAQRISLWEHGDADRYQDTKCAQDVPVAKARKAATMKMMAGKSCCSPAALLATTPETYSAAPSESVMLFNVQASVRMRMAGTIASKPLMRLLMASLNGKVFLDTKSITVRMKEASEPMTNPTEALLAAKASTKSR